MDANQTQTAPVRNNVQTKQTGVSWQTADGEVHERGQQHDIVEQQHADHNQQSRVGHDLARQLLVVCKCDKRKIKVDLTEDAVNSVVLDDQSSVEKAEANHEAAVAEVAVGRRGASEEQHGNSLQASPSKNHHAKQRAGRLDDFVFAINEHADKQHKQQAEQDVGGKLYNLRITSITTLTGLSLTACVAADTAGRTYCTCRTLLRCHGVLTSCTSTTMRSQHSQLQLQTTATSPTATTWSGVHEICCCCFKITTSRHRPSPTLTLYATSISAEQTTSERERARVRAEASSSDGQRLRGRHEVAQQAKTRHVCDERRRKHGGESRRGVGEAGRPRRQTCKAKLKWNRVD